MQCGPAALRQVVQRAPEQGREDEPHIGGDHGGQADQIGGLVAVFQLVQAPVLCP